MNVFFDVDYTIIAVDGTLRPLTQQIFSKIIDDGHVIFVWSGIGLRTSDVKQNKLDKYVSGIFTKPVQNFEEGLTEFSVDPRPDFVVDDHPEIVQAFGGYHIRPYFFKNSEDREMEAVYIAISEFQNDISIGRISSIQSEIDLEDTKGF